MNERRFEASSYVSRRSFSSQAVQGHRDVHLTNREKEVLSLIACGYSNKYAARELKISPHTIAGYIKDIYRKLQISCRSEATLMAISSGLIDTGLFVSRD